jgi:hypothetical protein
MEVAEPPTVERLTVTARPVLVGLAPGVTATVRREAYPLRTFDGLERPTPVGFVPDEHGLAGVAVFRGLDPPVAKSAPF